MAYLLLFTAIVGVALVIVLVLLNLGGKHAI